MLRYTNNTAGDLLALVDGKNQVTQWHYDEFGRVTNKLDQTGSVILSDAYDPANRSPTTAPPASMVRPHGKPRRTKT